MLMKEGKAGSVHDKSEDELLWAGLTIHAVGMISVTRIAKIAVSHTWEI